MFANEISSSVNMDVDNRCLEWDREEKKEARTLGFTAAFVIACCCCCWSFFCCCYCSRCKKPLLGFTLELRTEWQAPNNAQSKKKKKYTQRMSICNNYKSLKLLHLVVVFFMLKRLQLQLPCFFLIQVQLKNVTSHRRQTFGFEILIDLIIIFARFFLAFIRSSS